MQVRYKLNGREVTAEQFSQGGSGKLSEMLASRQPPMSNTDREFLEGTHRQFEKCPHIGDWYKRQAESVGVDVTGKVYLSGLAAYPGDPRAWVSGRGDVQKVCEERGYGCDGSVKVKMREQEPKEIPLAEDIIQEEVRSIVEDSPEPVRDIEAVRESVIQNRTPYWAQ